MMQEQPVVAPDVRVPPPPATERDGPTELIHGIDVADPYRWLEEEGDRTQAWTAAHVARTRAVLDALPGRDGIERRLTALLSTGVVTVPVVRRGRLFYQRREGEQNQPILYVRESDPAPPRILLDPNQLRSDGTVALDWWYPSLDGALTAYGLSEGGDEQSTLSVIDVSTGTVLPDRIPRTRAASVAWLPDGSGFFYTRYPDVTGQGHYDRHVFFHALGADPMTDDDVFGAGRSPQDWPGVDLSPDGRFLLVTVQQGWSKSEMYVCDLAAEANPRRPRTFVPIADGIDARFFGDIYDGVLYVTTNLDALNSKVVAVDPLRPERESWRELIPERDDVALEYAGVIAGRLAVVGLQRASSLLEVYRLDGMRERSDVLPGIGSITGLGGEPDGHTMYFGFASFATPPTIYRLDIPNGDVERYDGVDLPPGVDPSAYLVEQVWYPSSDGERISMFVVRRRDASLDGKRPTLLTGYGGFNASMTPSFVRSLPFWLDHGGVYALPNLRGGGEYGERWHRAGMLDQKQHVFDDVIAAGEWLVASGVTRPDRLAIQGGSNGGLLVGAAITQRPGLFRAAVCAVPLLDMVRYHRFQIAKLWIAEYGDPDRPEDFAWLYAYSPYHRVTPGTAYPAVLLTTAEGDSRVDPMHARKMAAALQFATASDHEKRPVLLRVEERAGHGAGKPLTKVIAESTDMWSFVCWQLGVPVAPVHLPE